MKIKLSPSKKTYLKGKNVYGYIKAQLLVPHKFFKRLEPYFEDDFQVDFADEENKVTVTYTHFKKPKAQQK